MNAELQAALATYDRIGWGGEIPASDLEIAHDALLKIVHESGMDLGDAVRLVHMVEGGNWSKGWSRGYDSARNHYTVSVRPSFSLGIQS
jgi:hypothetical protein